MLLHHLNSLLAPFAQPGKWHHHSLLPTSTCSTALSSPETWPVTHQAIIRFLGPAAEYPLDLASQGMQHEI
jgi:hypothetical protein